MGEVHTQEAGLQMNFRHRSTPQKELVLLKALLVVPWLAHQSGARRRREARLTLLELAAIQKSVPQGVKIRPGMGTLGEFDPFQRKIRGRRRRDRRKSLKYTVGDKEMSQKELGWDMVIMKSKTRCFPRHSVIKAASDDYAVRPLEKHPKDLEEFYHSSLERTAIRERMTRTWEPLGEAIAHDPQMHLDSGSIYSMELDLMP